MLAHQREAIMSKRRRTLIGIVLVELLLAGLWYYLHLQMTASPDADPEAAASLGRTLGGAMGLVLGLTPALYLFARRNDLKDAERHRSG
jgi:hypothetical protein